MIEAAADVYGAAGLVVHLEQKPVAPLRMIIRGLGLTVDEVTMLTGSSAAAHLEAQARRPMITADIAPDNLAGFLSANASGGWILVESADPLVRRRFTIAHELGHYVLHFMPLLAHAAQFGGADDVEFTEALTSAEDDNEVISGSGRIIVSEMSDIDSAALHPERMEKEANRFAAELLMPETMCRRLVSEVAERVAGKRRVAARRLATEFLVSEVAMRIRLADLGLMEG
ncbi:MAG: ImmA/IrrE family metallo-endopeptidase [Dehalococcoidia bacterium]